MYYFAAELRSQIIVYSGIVSTIVFPSEGIALAFAIYFGKRVWPGIFIGQFFIAYGNGLDFTSSFAISAINSLEAIIAVTLFHRFKLNKRLEHFRDIIGLSFLILFILQPFSALSSNLILLLTGHIQTGNFFHSVFSWWFGNIMGQSLYTPFLLLLFANYKKIQLQKFLIYSTLFTLYLFILIYFLNISSSLLLLSITLPILLYVTYLENIVLSLFMTILNSYLLSFFMFLGKGPFFYHNGTIHLIDYNLYLLTSVLTILTANILFDFYKLQEQRLQERIRKEVEKNKEQQLLMFHQNRLAQMGEMMAMIAHQWRQPLNNLSLLQQLIISKYKKNKLDDNVMNYFQSNVTTHINMMSETINDFNNFFKPQEKKQWFEINEVILNILNIMKPSLYKKNIKIIFLAPSNYKYLGYKNSLGHALLNIINNAQDAFEEREKEEKKIIIEIKDSGEDFILSISDNAGGIPADIIENIFDPYFSTKDEKNGTGLGLYMTKMIITEHMNSIIKVHNNHEGAVFEIILKGELCERVT